MAYIDVIKIHQSQLQDFLTRKYGDQSVLLGFNASIQAKFSTWITQDMDNYYKHPEMEFTVIDLIDKLWMDFHNPIIKYFEQHHAMVFDEQNKELKTCQRESRPGEFKVRPVEMRKINESFLKYSREIYQFYLKLVKLFATRYTNPNIPKSFLQKFDFTVARDANVSRDDNFLGNMIQLIHKCCICLGNILRHQAFIETNYVTPCKSNKNFFKFKSLPDKKSQFRVYEKSMQLYNLSIMLLPALSEPYNRIGIVYNSVDDKFNAIYWFLRSQLTRVSDPNIGFNNMTTILNKNWFTTALVDIISGNRERRFSKSAEMNVYLICLVGYIYCPERYKNGPNIVKKIPFSKVETELFKLLNTEFDDQVVLNHLVVIFAFVKLTKGDDQLEKVLKFAFRYVERVLGCLKTVDGLVVLRFMLNLFWENSNWLDVFVSRRNCVMYLSTVLNRYVENCDTTGRPTRMFFFKEDVDFRDCSLVKYQFKDFKDESMFDPYDVNLIVGDYSNCDLQEPVEEYIRGKRIAAIVVLGLKILDRANKFKLVQDEQKKISMKKPRDQPVVVPNTLADIELMIAQQNKQLTMDIDNHQGMQNMVDKLVDDTHTTSGFWKNEHPKQTTTPDFLNPTNPQSRDVFL